MASGEGFFFQSPVRDQSFIDHLYSPFCGILKTKSQFPLYSETGKYSVMFASKSQCRERHPFLTLALL